MMGPKRAAAEQRQRDPIPRETQGSEPEAMRVWLLGGFRVSVGSRTIEGNGWRRRKAGSLI